MMMPHKLPKPTPRYIPSNCTEGVKKTIKKPDGRGVCFPANILYSYLPDWVYHLPQLAQIKIYHFTFGTSITVTTVLSVL